MAEKRLALDQIPSASPLSGSDKTREIVSISKTNGPEYTGALHVLSGMSLPLTLPLAGKVAVHASLSCGSIGSLNLPSSIQLYIRVDGVDHCVFSSVLDIGVPGPSYGLAAAGVWAETLSPGPHTFELAVSGNCNVYANATFPATLVVDYPQDLIGGGGAGDANLITVQAVSPTPLVLTGANVTIPGTPIAFSLTQTKTVVFSGNATIFSATFADNFLVLRVDGIDYDGTEYHTAPTANIGMVFAERSIVLSPGPHTAELRARMPAGAGGTVQGGVTPSFLSATWATGGGGVSGVGASTLVSVEAANTSGLPTTNTTAVYAPVPGTMVSINLLNQQVVLFEALGTVLPTPNGFCGQIGIRIDGIDYDGTAVDWDTIYFILSDTVVAHKAISLAPGLHTAQIVLREPAARGRDAKLTNSSTLPTRLTAVYAEPVFGVGSLEKQDAQNVTGVKTVNATTVYALIPGTAVSINLLTDQVVMFTGYATHVPDTNGYNCQLGVRIDGVDYNGTIGEIAATFSLSDSTGIDVTKAISLAAGLHTAQLVMRRGAGAPIATVLNSVDAPSVLTAIYTNPEELVDIGIGTLAKGESENITGVATTAPSTTYVVVPGTSMTINLPVAQTVLFEGLATLGVSGAFNGQLGVRVDGIDYDGNAARFATFSGNDESGIMVSKALALAPGSHTATLVLRQAIATGGNASIFNSTTKPTRLTAIYTDPEEIVKSFLDYARDDTSGAFTTASPAPVVIPSPTVAFIQHKVGDVEAHLSCVSPINGVFRTRANTWLVLDGTTFIKVAYAAIDGVTSYGIAAGGVAVFPAVAVGSHTIQAALSTEDPVGATVLRDFLNAYTPNVSAPLTITVRHS